MFPNYETTAGGSNKKMDFHEPQIKVNFTGKGGSEGEAKALVCKKGLDT